MSSYNRQWVAPFQGMYVGDYGASITLTRVSAVRTGGAKMSVSVETEYTPLIDNEEQVGDVIVTCTVNFLHDDMAKRFVRGLAVAASLPGTIGNAQYSIFLVHPSYDTKQSYWLPQMGVKKNLDMTAAKDQASIIPITFVGTFRSVYKTLELEDTVANCLTAIGVARAPFTYP